MFIPQFFSLLLYRILFFGQNQLPITPVVGELCMGFFLSYSKISQRLVVYNYQVVYKYWGFSITQQNDIKFYSSFLFSLFWDNLSCKSDYR